MKCVLLFWISIRRILKNRNGFIYLNLELLNTGKNVASNPAGISLLPVEIIVTGNKRERY